MPTLWTINSATVIPDSTSNENIWWIKTFTWEIKVSWKLKIPVWVNLY